MTQREFEQKVMECTSAEDLRELSKQFFVETGAITREHRGVGAEVVVAAQRTYVPPTSKSVLDDYKDQLIRKAVTLPDGTIRMIEAYSQTGLDILEKSLTGKVTQ